MKHTSLLTILTAAAGTLLAATSVQSVTALLSSTGPIEPSIKREVSRNVATIPQYSEYKDYTLTVEVSGTDKMPTASLFSTLYELSYSPLSFTRNGDKYVAVLPVYGGGHRLTVEAEGMKTSVTEFSVDEDRTVSISLAEDVRKPYGVKTELQHDVITGRNDIMVEWNTEEAVFSDDFESYRPFSIDPSPWTGIDGDRTAPSVLSGNYANAGLPNYVQIINPWAVEPAWDLNNYFTLAPHSGHQYAGFIQTASGTPLDDWMITPFITPGEENVIRFYAKGSDAVDARFAVGITIVENPTPADFTIISEGNDIICGYSDWQEIVIPIDNYAGTPVKIGIHCTSLGGSFISMIDDFFVGRLQPSARNCSRRVSARSAQNPNERFEILLDGAKIGETTDYSYVIPDVSATNHTVGVKARYLHSESEVTETEVHIDADRYKQQSFAIVTNNNEIPAEAALTLEGENENDTYHLTIENGTLTITSLPTGKYSVSVSAPHYDTLDTEITVTTHHAHVFTLSETLVTPFNITADVTTSDNGHEVTVKWNQHLGFEESFEEYKDFATGTFGGWTTFDFDTKASYPIGLGSQSNIVTFPNASTPTNPQIVPPMVFNPYSTLPSMESDYGILAPDGIKSIAFFGPQGATADKWLISPLLTIRDNYQWEFVAKAYDIYPEKLELLISEESLDINTFRSLDVVSPPAGEWTQYTLDLSEYAGKDVYLAIRCISFDGFLVQVDRFKVGPSAGNGPADVGKVIDYSVSLDGGEAVKTTEPTFHFTNLTEGSHTVAISANYVSGTSQKGEYTFTVSPSGVEDVTASDLIITAAQGGVNITPAVKTEIMIADMSGRIISRMTLDNPVFVPLAPGLYVITAGATTHKIIVR